MVACDHPDIDLVILEDTAVVSLTVSNVLNVLGHLFPKLIIQAESAHVDQVFLKLLSVLWRLYRILLR